MSTDVDALLVSAQAGDRKAFEALVRALERPIYVAAYAILPNREEALDVVQETFLRLFGNLHKVKSEARFKCFVFKIAVNCAIDRLRRLKRQRISLSEDGTLPAATEMELSRRIESPEKLAEKRELLQTLQAVIDDLPPRQKLCLVLSDLDGLSKKEIARTLGCPQGTVRSNLHIARQKLRRALKDHV